MKKIYDLFDFNEVEIKTRTDSYDRVYTATLKKHMTFEMFDEREYLPTKEEWIEKAKETFVKKIISDDFINKCDENDAKYFTDLKNAIESTGLVDQFLWDRGYKRIGSTWQPQSISQKQSSVEWLLNWMEKNQYFIGNDLLHAVEQAKAMHKEEIEKTAITCHFAGTRQKGKNSEEYIEYGKQYYNEIFGGQE